MHVRLLICLSTLIAALCVPSAASAAGASGSLTMTRPDAPAATATWGVSGAMLPARAAAATAGLAYNTATLFDSDSRYVHANLQSADRATTVDDCGDGMGGVTTQSLSGVAAASSIMRLDIVLNQLSGRGTATFGLAMDPYGSIDRTFLSGQTYYHMSSNCYGSQVGEDTPVDAVGGSGPFILNGYMAQQTLLLHWPIVRSRGAWHLSGSKYVGDGFLTDNTVKANLIITGSAASMHATCHVPNPHDLRAARTDAAAKRIMTSAGFPRVTVTRPRRSRAAYRGHYFISNMVGNANPILCGSRYPKVTRSLGW